MEALRQLEENMVGAPMYDPHPQSPPHEWSLEDFLKHQPTKFDGKTSPNLADQWMKDMERIFDAKRCPDESRLAFTVYLLTGEVEHWWASMMLVMEEKHEQVNWRHLRGSSYQNTSPIA